MRLKSKRLWDTPENELGQVYHKIQEPRTKALCPRTELSSQNDNLCLCAYLCLSGQMKMHRLLYHRSEAGQDLPGLTRVRVTIAEEIIDGGERLDQSNKARS